MVSQQPALLITSLEYGVVPHSVKMGVKSNRTDLTGTLAKRDETQMALAMSAKCVAILDYPTFCCSVSA